MKKFIIVLICGIASAVGCNATILFPHFVDIAPAYSQGNIPSLVAAGINEVGLSCETTSYYPKTFEQAVSFFKDTLPGDVQLEEKKVGNQRLFIYTSITKNSSDTIETSGYFCRIYMLEMPDGSYQSGYYETEVPVK